MKIFAGGSQFPWIKRLISMWFKLTKGTVKKKFTLRGLHYQEDEHSQAKLVSCLHGAIFNVAVDLRLGKTYGHAYSEVLTFENHKQMTP